MSKQPPPAPTASAVGPCPTLIQTVGRPGTGSLPCTIAPSGRPLFLLVFVRLLQWPVRNSSDVTFHWYNVRCLDFESNPRVYYLSRCANNIDPSGIQRWIVTRSPDTCTQLLSIRHLVTCMVCTGYCGTNNIEHGLIACTVDYSLAKARGLFPRTCEQTKLCLLYNIISVS